MNQLILQYEPTIRLGFFVGILVFMSLWEILAPRRSLTTSRKTRWSRNLALALFGTLLARALPGVTGVAVAIRAQEGGWGLLKLAGLPEWAVPIAGVVVLDLAIYLQHVMFHHVPALWRLHRVHHTDLDYDWTTGIRFHPVEIVLSMFIKGAVVAAMGVPSVAVVIFEVLLNATSVFNHGNVRMSAGIDAVLRLFVVTPDMHRVHHSVEPKETHSNFGFNIPWWDRLLGTYRSQPERGHGGMTIGVPQFRDASSLTLPRLLVLPFLRHVCGEFGSGISGRRGA